MAVYHEAPFTIDGISEIPEDAAPAVGVDEYGNREAVAEASAEWSPDTLIDVQVGSRGNPFEVEVTLAPATEFEDDYAVDWDFGDGTRQTGHDLVQRNTYAAPGAYDISAVVRQPGLTSVAVSTSCAFDQDGALI